MGILGIVHKVSYFGNESVMGIYSTWGGIIAHFRYFGSGRDGVQIFSYDHNVVSNFFRDWGPR